LSTTASSQRIPSSRSEVALLAAVVLLGGLLVPGLGAALALILAFTRLSQNSSAVRLGIVALGFIIIAIQIGGLLAGTDQSWVSPAHLVEQ
jgi:hypothetical protein